KAVVGQPGLLSDAEGGIDCGSDVLDCGVQSSPTPGEEWRGKVRVSPAGARTRMGRAPAALLGARGLHDARAGHELLCRARFIRAGARSRGQFLRRIHCGTAGSLAADVAAAVE